MAGRCDADYLNKTFYETKEVLECQSRGKEEYCNRVTYYRINNVLPKYCVSYINHEWTDLNSTLHYQGASEWIKKNSVSGWNNQGGKWID
ncbi:TrbM/KikA/MpfK family conjugal transfer protein [Xenorhabdus sp. PB62.4]|uniref:TrbM/KikA/MpfK family conjugal transfer protein n=1 Tax=Xenorhabdus sp. PB62.4 TaxID=1851573 RepID=UPI001656B96A|nr:TrbM/KikA/MpfK family conjugal transfer protein [Xenorhabdus sp. PB62.4]